MLGCRIVKNRIRILLGFYLARRLQRLQVKHDSRAQFSVANEPFAKLRHEGYSVVSLKATGNGAHQGAAVGIAYKEVRAVGEIDAARGRIDCDVVEILAATRGGAKGNFLEQMVTARRRSRRDISRQTEKAQAHQPTAESRALHGNLQSTACYFTRLS